MSLIGAIRHHHDPMTAPEPHGKFAALINLASTIALASGSTFELEPAPSDRDESAMETLNLLGDRLDELTGSLSVQSAHLKQAFA